MITLSFWEKVAVVSGGVALVVVAAILVFCVVYPSCPLHRLLPERARLPINSPRRRKKKRWLLTGSVSLGNPDSETSKLNTGSTYITYSHEPQSRHDTLESTDKCKEVSNWFADAITLRNTRPPISPQQPTKTSVLVSRESTVDSSYNSMTPTGSRPSTPVSSKRSSQSDLVLAESMSSLTDSCSLRSADLSPLYGAVTISLQLKSTTLDNMVRLTIGIKEAQDLPPRDRLSCGDPFFRLRVMREGNKTFGKRSKPKSELLAEFTSNIQKKTRHPIFNQDFSTQISISDIKGCEIHLVCFDKDKYANSTELGVAVIYLKNVQLSQSAHPISLCLELTEPKRMNGEMQIGVMYLPTAERLTFNNFKVTNIPLNQSESNLKLFIRVLALHNGKMVCKKKTESLPFSPPTATSIDDCLAFDVPTDQLANLSFMVVVVVVFPSDNAAASSDSDSTIIETGGRCERLMGKVILGPNSKSTGLQHWEIALHRPREQIVLWHVLR